MLMSEQELEKELKDALKRIERLEKCFETYERIVHDHTIQLSNMSNGPDRQENIDDIDEIIG
jgi:hypothetical protein